MMFRLKHSNKTQMYYSNRRARVFSFFLRPAAGSRVVAFVRKSAGAPETLSTRELARLRGFCALLEGVACETTSAVTETV